METEAKLRELGVDLPDAPAAVAAYEPFVVSGDQVVTSGQLPWEGGSLAYTGRLGDELDVEAGYEAARLCAINSIAQLKAAVGDLDRISRIVRVEGNVHAAPGFRGHPQVLDGASDLFNAAFGERGRHTRTALGTNEMPLDAPIQLGVWAEIRPESGPEGSRPRARSGAVFAHLTLVTRDVTSTRDFFEATFGWRVIARPGNIEREAAWLEIAPGQQLHLLHVADFEPSPFEREFGRHVAIAFPLEGFAELKKRLLERGAELIAPERETPFERFFFRDPNGYVFEVVEGA